MMMFGWLILLGVGGWFAWQALQRRQPQSAHEPPRGQAVRILEERFARGEIDRDEFEARRQALLGAQRYEEDRV